MTCNTVENNNIWLLHTYIINTYMIINIIQGSHSANNQLWVHMIRKVTMVRASVETKYVHDDVIKWKHFPRNWPFVRRIHRSPVNSPHKGQWRGALMFTLICVWINGWVNNREAGDLRRYRGHYDVIVMFSSNCISKQLARFEKPECTHLMNVMLYDHLHDFPQR